MSLAEISEREQSTADMLEAIGIAARKAAANLAIAPAAAKSQALQEAANIMRQRQKSIQDANQQDMVAAREHGLSAAMLDRLALDATRIEGIATGLEAVAALPDPVGAVIAQRDRPNGLKISQVRVPIGVIGVIYESRPNVTADAGALCLKAGNAAILRGGSESFLSAQAIHACLADGLAAAGLPETAIQRIPTRDRAAVGWLLTRPEYVDVVVPRGGRSLVERVQNEARVPVFAHLEGICHVYVAAGADLDMAMAIAVNAKMRRTGICGAAETLLVDARVADSHLAPLIKALIAAGCQVRGDAAAQAADARVQPATDADWAQEYLDAVISVRVVDGLDAAVAHISTYGSQHTEAIVTEDKGLAAAFLQKVDSAIVMHNASTQFADGGEFGMGAEIGISTGRLHARGPVGAVELTTSKYRVEGSGQIRP